jgi:hypothetical protein
VRRTKHGTAKVRSKELNAKIEAGKKLAASEKQQVIEEHLPPLALTFIILACSGFLLVFALRDFLSTGKNIAGKWDESMLVRSCCRSSSTGVVVSCCDMVRNLIGLHTPSCFSTSAFSFIPLILSSYSQNLLTGLMTQKVGKARKEDSVPSRR